MNHPDEDNEYPHIFIDTPDTEIETPEYVFENPDCSVTPDKISEL